MSDLDQLCAALRCPDDGGVVEIQTTAVTCVRCGRRYARPAPNVVEMISGIPQPPLAGVAPDFYSAYLSLRTARLDLSGATAAWGAPETMPPEWVRLRRCYSDRVVDLVLRRLGDRGGIVLDTSAGAGFVSFALAERGVTTIHSDLDPQSIGYAARWLNGGPRQHALLAVRADYFALPLRGTADVIIATDSLIRGVEHEVAALRAIRLALRDDGVAIVDFHNWLHNPLRRMGLLSDNFIGNRSYFGWEVGRLLGRAGLEVVMEVRYRQEEDQPGVRSILAPLVPSTRFVRVVRRA